MNTIEEHKGRYAGKVALIILGGPSASRWADVKEKTSPDIILGANGVNSMIDNLDYWMCIENMRRTARLASRKDKRAKEFMQMFQRIGPKNRIVNVKGYEYLKNKDNAIPAKRREAFEFDKVPADFSFREYGSGFIKGALMKHKNAISANLSLPVGTVGLQMLHLVGILGCRAVHTIGLDLCFRGKNHHAYSYPPYQPNHYFMPENFTEYKGMKTMWFWIETSQYLLGIKKQMDKVGLQWVDHSNGLLQAMQKDFRE